MLAFVYFKYAGASVIKAPPESAGAVLSDSRLTPAPLKVLKGRFFLTIKEGC